MWKRSFIVLFEEIYKYSFQRKFGLPLAIIIIIVDTIMATKI